MIWILFYYYWGQLTFFCREPWSPDQESMTLAPGVVHSQSFRFSRIAYVRKHSLLFLYLLVATTSCHLKSVQQLPMVLSVNILCFCNALQCIFFPDTQLSSHPLPYICFFPPPPSDTDFALLWFLSVQSFFFRGDR